MILTYPNPILLQTTQPLTSQEIQTKEVMDMVDLMREVMVESNGIGIAAPQIGWNKSCVISNGLVLFNPRLESTGNGFIHSFEQCLSIPGKSYEVVRNKGVRAFYLNEEGKERTLAFYEFPAIVVQHEVDHLWGITLANNAAATEFGGL